MTALPPLTGLADDVERLYCTIAEDRIDARRIADALRGHATLTRATGLGEDARDGARYREWRVRPSFAMTRGNWSTPEQIDNLVDAALAIPAEGEGA